MDEDLDLDFADELEALSQLEDGMTLYYRSPPGICL